MMAQIWADDRVPLNESGMRMIFCMAFLLGLGKEKQGRSIGAATPAVGQLTDRFRR
jgi:hypothetical protein